MPSQVSEDFDIFLFVFLKCDSFSDIVIMGIGVVSIVSVFGYIAYMRHIYEDLGYYTAVKADGTEVFEKKKSRWER
jgi:Domain of unknown function (DUF4500)